MALFQNVGLSEEQAKFANLGLGGIMVLMTLVSIPLMDRAGRRTLHLTGLTGMIVLSIVFNISYHFAVEVEHVVCIHVSHLMPHIFSVLRRHTMQLVMYIYNAIPEAYAYAYCITN